MHATPERPAGSQRSVWFTEARFGLFVHFGLYSLAARHEWVKNREHLTDATYQKYFDNFRADLFDPAQWARDARNAGMRYAVLTTKHHDGFCLWDSTLTDYKVTRTPARRDIVAEFVEAFRAEGLRVGFYHSLIDWHHPDFPLDSLHPAWEEGADRSGRSIERYAEYLHGQVRELLTTYTPDVLWFDFSYPGERHGGKGRTDWQSEKLVAMVRELAPDILLNDRLDLPGSEDFLTPEEVAPVEDPTANRPGLAWEACRTLNGSWGYAPGFQQWHDAGQVVRLLVDTISKNGNLLLNVGPTGRGAFEPRARRLLEQVGEWTTVHAAAVYGAGASDLPCPPDCRVAQAGNRVFVYVMAWPTSDLALTGLAGRLRYASFMHDGAEVQFSEVSDEEPESPHIVPAAPPGAVILDLPTQHPDVLVPVIELVLTD